MRSSFILTPQPQASMCCYVIDQDKVVHKLPECDDLQLKYKKWALYALHLILIDQVKK